MIKSYIGAKSNGEFTEIVKMRPQHYSAQMQENGKVGETMLLKILVNIPEISPRWLLYGEGEMLREGMDVNKPVSASENENLMRETIKNLNYTINEQREKIERLQVALKNRQDNAPNPNLFKIEKLTYNE